MSWFWGALSAQPESCGQSFQAIGTELLLRYPARRVWAEPQPLFSVGAMAGPHDAPPQSCGARASTARLQLIGRCRLDNLPALVEELGLQRQHSRALTDVDVVLAAYQRWGVECVQHLRGDWAFGLWDAARERLLLARDATGSSCLMWWHGNQGTLFSNCLPALIKAPLVPARPDLRWALDMLMVFSDPAEPCASGYERVGSLPPGHCVVVERGVERLHRWWRPEESVPFDHAPIEAFEEEFLRLYADAVRQRLRRVSGNLAATLSGGLDSGSVVAMAAPMLAAEGRTLRAYAHVPLFDVADANNQTGNEWDLASATAQHVGNVELLACNSRACSPIRAMQEVLQATALPWHAAGNMYWLHDIAAQAAVNGDSVLLLGRAGNQTVSFGGSASLWPAVAQGCWAHVWQELRSEESSFARAIATRLLKPPLREVRGAWRYAHAKSAYANRPWQHYAWVTPEAVSEFGMLSRMVQAHHDVMFVKQSPQRMLRWRHGLLMGGLGDGAFNVLLGEMHGVSFRDPTGAQDLLEFCLRVPPSAYWAHGKQRGFVRHAMRQRLPDDVLRSRRKGLQSADLVQRLRQSPQELDAAVQSVSGHADVCRLIDMPRVQAAVGELQAGNLGHADACHMTRALMVGLMLAKH